MKIIKPLFLIITVLFYVCSSAKPPNEGGPPVPFGDNIGDESAINMYIYALISFVFIISFLYVIIFGYLKRKITVH